MAMECGESIDTMLRNADSVVVGKERVPSGIWDRITGRKSGYALRMRQEVFYPEEVLDFAKNALTRRTGHKKSFHLMYVDELLYKEIPVGFVFKNSGGLEN